MSLSLVHAQKSTIGRANIVQKLTQWSEHGGSGARGHGGGAALRDGLSAQAAPARGGVGRRRRQDSRSRRRTAISPHGSGATDQRRCCWFTVGPGRGLQLGAFVEPLVEAGYRVVAYDGPAHGESPGRRTNIFKLTEGLMAVADAVGPLSGVIAHSLGTTAVLLAASRLRLRSGSICRRLAHGRDPNHDRTLRSR